MDRQPQRYILLCYAEPHSTSRHEMSMLHCRVLPRRPASMSLVCATFPGKHADETSFPHSLVANGTSATAPTPEQLTRHVQLVSKQATPS